MIPFPGAFISGLVLFLVIAWDAFEAIILPRRVTRKFRVTRLFYRVTWPMWKFIAAIIASRRVRDTFLSYYGPISLLALLGIWAIGLVIGFGMMQYGAGSALNVTGSSPSFYTDVYLSGTTFFTLGLGDVVPRSPLARFLVVAEGGFGFGFLAAIIGYLPFIYGAFASREINISLLDARAGTPPTAGEMLRRHSYPRGREALQVLLKDWELWSAQIMESHLSYPVLAFFRSQHDNQSWVAALTAILDTCAIVIAAVDDGCARQAELTFAIARHATVDLTQVFSVAPRPLPENRLPAEEWLRLRTKLDKFGMKLSDSPEATLKLSELREMYEPYAYALANLLSQTLPPWIPTKKGRDNWQTTAWAQTAGVVQAEEALLHDDHF